MRGSAGAREDLRWLGQVGVDAGDSDQAFDKEILGRIHRAGQNLNLWSWFIDDLSTGARSLRDAQQAGASSVDNEMRMTRVRVHSTKPCLLVGTVLPLFLLHFELFLWLPTTIPSKAAKKTRATIAHVVEREKYVFFFVFVFVCA